jgi:hypothetical protein
MKRMNEITIQQNQPHQLERLGAISQFYLQAKRLLGLNMLLSVPLALVWSIVVAVVPTLDIYAAVWGILITLLGILVLNPAQKDLQTKAAKIQQLFDCELFQMDWQDFNIGSPPSRETIFRANAQYTKSNPAYEKLKDWYPLPISTLPLPLARLVCQRTNCWWDAELRRRYAAWDIAILGILSVLVLVIGLIGGLTLAKFCSVVAAPLSPALSLGITQYRENMQAATNLDRLRDKAEDIWFRALKQQETPQALHHYSVQLQDAIFDNRSNSPLIFNWFYNWLRDEKQASMNKGAETLVDEAMQALGQSP